uniref:NADH dehydrogenase subunit 6 n=1 Tax=Acropyga kinomurai TaxID=602213 RepID=A0A6G5NIE3_9HYME|nr:NADH dehydrogenase subunit 6 [Acropyga kinomurai]QBG38631.1 NADH dehydrogenase subunit 6 [Acropyga kinomurai]
MTKELLIENSIIMFFMLMILFNLMINIKNFNPILTMLNMIFYCLIICMNISLWKSNFLYSIILFLIMVSGLLIIFLYFSSLISNEQFNFNLNKLLLTNFLMNFSIFMMLNYKLNFMNLMMKKFNMLEINLIVKLNSTFYQNFINMYEYPFNNMTIISMLYLLISLFSIIKICSIKSLMLRKIN